MTIKGIKDKIRNGEYRFSDHAVNPVRNSSGALNPAGIILKSNPAAEQRGIISNGVKRMIKRSINRSEIEDAVMAGEIIEEYPNDIYSPSCLIYGRTRDGRDLHVQLSLPPSVVIITAYEPDESEWIDRRVRR
jgi:hypothetical protein